MLSPQAFSLRIALALLILETKPDSTSLADYLFELRQEAISRDEATQNLGIYGRSTAGERATDDRVRDGNRNEEQTRSCSDPLVNELRQAANLLSPDVLTALRDVLCLLQQHENSTVETTSIDIPVSSLYSISIPTHQLPSFLARVQNLEQHMGNEVEQELARPDLDRQSVRFEAVVNSVQMLVPFVVGLSVRFLGAQDTLGNEDQDEEEGEGERSRHEKNEENDELSKLLITLIRSSLSLPSNFMDHSTRLANLVLDVLSALPTLFPVLIAALLEDLVPRIESLASITDASSASATATSSSQTTHLDALFGYLNIFLTRLPSPYDGRQRTRLQELIIRLSGVLAREGVDDRLGEKVESSCFGILELCWCKLSIE